MDANDKDKTGIQKYSDLILWKQILDFAKLENVPIILIIDDVKLDWCYSEKHANETRIIRPREELITELYDYAKVNFWMYTTSQFLYKFQDHFSLKIEDSIIIDVEQNTKDFSLSYESLYISQYSDYGTCLKFFKDGTVVGVSVSGNVLESESLQKTLNSWFTSAYENKGTFKITNNRLEFILVSSHGEVHYAGEIQLDNLELTIHSMINGNISKRIFSLVKNRDITKTN